MVEALQRVLWEVLHPQQADGLWTRGAVHQGDALVDLQLHQQCGQFLKKSQWNASLNMETEMQIITMVAGLPGFFFLGI